MIKIYFFFSCPIPQQCLATGHSVFLVQYMCTHGIWHCSVRSICRWFACMSCHILPVIFSMCAGHQFRISWGVLASVLLLFSIESILNSHTHIRIIYGRALAHTYIFLTEHGISWDNGKDKLGLSWAKLRPRLANLATKRTLPVKYT